MLRRIEVVPYDPTWPARFAEEAARLTPIFGENLVTLHHIGSTAVPGLHAKPIIDMLPEVYSLEKVEAVNDAMLAAGYEVKGENGIPGRRYFRKGGDLHRSHHVHVFAQGNPEIARHVNFCAYLRAHPVAAQHYGDLKQALAEQHPHEIVAYLNGKSALIAELDAKAAAWRAAVLRPQDTDEGIEK